MLLAHLLVQLARLGAEVVLEVVVEQRRDHRHRARRVEHVHHRRVGVHGLDLDGRVHAGGGSAADEERHLHVAALHLLGDRHHLVERGRDEPREPDHVRADLDGLVEDVLARAHDADVDDVVVVAAEHHPDNVLADVVHVALDRRHQHAARLLLQHVGVLGELARFLLLHERRQVRHGLLHHARRLDHLGKEHLSGSEEVADGVHALHERALDDVERRRVGDGVRASLLGVELDELVNALQERVDQALLHRRRPPLRSSLLRYQVAAASLDLRDALLLLLCAIEELLGGVGAGVEHRSLAHGAQLRLDVVVDRQVAGVDDGHVHAVLDGVVEEHSVHRLADHFEATEREGQVGESAADLGARAGVLDDLGRLDEVDAVVVVLLEARADGEDVEIEDDVNRVEVALLDEHLVGALADAHLRLAVRSLALLVKCHHDDGGAVAADELGLRLELLLADLERDGVDDALALQALEARDGDVELGRVDDHRDLCDLGLRRDQVAELAHAVLAVEHAVVEVDVQQLRAILHLLLRDLRRLAPVVRHDQLLEPDRARNVAALADVLEHAVGRDREVLETRQAHVVRVVRDGARGLHIRDRVSDSLDMIGGSAAAASDHVNQPVHSPLAELGGHVLGREVVATHGVGEAGIGVGVGVASSAVREARHEGAHLVGAEGAVEADAEGLRVLDADPEGLGGLS
mmetsp:Transcript_15591/g.36733  ORF Transcript_15591/g.36733 Transcript_15591/m.36733 type:complete len:692 (-) Transcript_15591:781-2856(-)